MSDCIKLNKGNIDVCEREVIVLREIIAAAMGRLHQMRKQCERGYVFGGFRECVGCVRSNQ